MIEQGDTSQTDLTTVSNKVDMQINLPWRLVSRIAAIAYLDSIAFDRAIERMIEGDVYGG